MILAPFAQRNSFSYLLFKHSVFPCISKVALLGLLPLRVALGDRINVKGYTGWLQLADTSPFLYTLDASHNIIFFADKIEGRNRPE
jgi:hypothetical protein